MKTDIELVNVSDFLKKKVDARVASHYTVLPLSLEEDHLLLAVSEDFNSEIREELQVLIGHEIRSVVFEKSEIENAIARCYGVGARVIETLAEKSDFKNLTGLLDKEAIEIVGRNDEDPTISKLVNQLILDAIESRASDIHIEPFERSFSIRYRIDGLLRVAKVSDKIRALSPNLISRIKIMAKLDIGEKRLSQDGRIKIRLHSDEFDLRISVLPSCYGEAIVIRILKPLQMIALEDLGFDGTSLEKMRQSLKRPYGMILVTGPTGSGKTTTLYASLKELNQPEYKIITIEDPIEYKLSGIVQMQTNSKIDFTFVSALRGMLRHDPDCLMVGEIRDSETAELAASSALTGHLVLSTLHTNDAPSAVTRMLELGLEPYLVASTLSTVVAQRLVRKACPPCDKCQGTGYFGRVAIHEVMVISDSLKLMIAERKNASELRTRAIEEGMISLHESAIQKVKSGITTQEEVDRIL